MFHPVEYPNLQAEGWVVRSPPSAKYNCIAWAVGENRKWWWPDIGLQYYWPQGAVRAETVEAFVQAFALMGFLECGPGYDVGIQRIALYALNGVPKHAAKQIDDRLWHSKMGRNINIEHTLRGLEGPVYGQVIKIFGKSA